MKSWWQGLQARERRLLLAGAVLLTLLAVYAGVWEPYMRKLDNLEARVASQQELLVWMEQSAGEVRALRGGASAGPAVAGQSLLALVDRTAKARGLGGAVKRMQPEGTGTVRVWLEQAPFDQVLAWLDTLAHDHGVRIGGVVAEREDVAGRTNARLVLEASQ